MSPLSVITVPTLLGLTLLGGAVWGQAPSPPPTPSPLTVPDLTLLKQALAPLAGDGMLQSLSSLQMTGSKEGISFTFHETARVVAKRPDKFRAYVTQYTADGAPERRLIIISDGKKVWTYRPATRQYCVTPAKAFHAGDNDMTALGLVQGGFFLGEGHEMAQGFAAITQENGPQVLAMLNGLGIRLTSRPEPAGGGGNTVYRMVLTRQGIAYRFFIDPATARLRRLELAGHQNGVVVLFREKVGEMETPAVVAKTTFAFTPPLGTTRVSSVPVDPF